MAARPPPSVLPGAPRIVVIGGGVSGLTCALLLAEAKLDVTLWSREAPLATTSAVAAAIWYPFEAGPADKVAGWAARSYRSFLALERAGTPGVTLVRVRDLHSPPQTRAPWVSALQGFRELSGAELAGYAEGWESEVPVIETPLYLPWLRARAEAHGVRFETRTLRSLEETRAYDAVLNASGLGARELVGDTRCYPIQGQIVRVPRGTVREAVYFQGPDAFGYVVPRGEDCVLGGTAVRGAESLVPDEGTSTAILERCRALEPRLASRTLSVAVGLRPGRDEIRVERERLPDGRPLVHDYGHGGCGVTLSWPCAEDARALLLEALG